MSESTPAPPSPEGEDESPDLVEGLVPVPESSDSAAGSSAPEPEGPDPAGLDPEGPDSQDPAQGIEDPLDPLTVLTVERDEYLDTLRRVQADFENYKKRVARQQIEQLDRAADSLVNKLIPALDTLELAVAHNDADSEAGLVLGQVSTALYDVLNKEGLEKLDPVDQEFDPNEAEAVMYEPADEGQTGHVVVEVFRPGYRWKGRVLRPAMVKVKG